MNWRLGFFRLWVALSVLWAIGWGWYAYAELWHRTFVVKDPNGLEFAVLAKRDTPKSDVIAFVQQNASAKQRQEDCATKPGPWCQHPMGLTMHNWTDGLALGIAFLLLPPTVIFVFGLTISWIASGFRAGHRSA